MQEIPFKERLVLSSFPLEVCRDWRFPETSEYVQQLRDEHQAGFSQLIEYKDWRPGFVRVTVIFPTAEHYGQTLLMRAQRAIPQLYCD